MTNQTKIIVISYGSVEPMVLGSLSWTDTPLAVQVHLHPLRFWEMGMKCVKLPRVVLVRTQHTLSVPESRSKHVLLQTPSKFKVTLTPRVSEWGDNEMPHKSEYCVPEINSNTSDAVKKKFTISFTSVKGLFKIIIYLN